ncbi:hypothetical protein OG889_30915 [Streptomyces sp. NBC_00481]|uniref:hypothetical protein n=1 Tax=unclassified Streptomyces TaxID=2593676 RepID=UPI002DD857F0|nr:MULTISPECIES: hypothetical protein [unclassified Streptomyces]WRY98713.1 hypothetical protein OG889_30915 [Streptomyces sp. NBC_00481]
MTKPRRTHEQRGPAPLAEKRDRAVSRRNAELEADSAVLCEHFHQSDGTLSSLPASS